MVLGQQFRTCTTGLGQQSCAPCSCAFLTGDVPWSIGVAAINVCASTSTTNAIENFRLMTVNIVAPRAHVWL